MRGLTLDSTAQLRELVRQPYQGRTVRVHAGDDVQHRVCVSHAPGQKVPLPVLIRCRHVELLTRPSCRWAHGLPCPTEPARTSAQQNEVVAFESTFETKRHPAAGSSSGTSRPVRAPNMVPTRRI